MGRIRGAVGGRGRGAGWTRDAGPLFRIQRCFPYSCIYYSQHKYMLAGAHAASRLLLCIATSMPSALRRARRCHAARTRRPCSASGARAGHAKAHAYPLPHLSQATSAITMGRPSRRATCPCLSGALEFVQPARERPRTRAAPPNLPAQACIAPLPPPARLPIVSSAAGSVAERRCHCTHLT